MLTTLLKQIRNRRLQLGLQIQDMPRQQYGKIEKDGNPRLSTLDLIAEGLDASMVLVPKDQLKLIEKILAGAPVYFEDDRPVDNYPENPWDDLP
jgi:transcriptional regulator with XRE-family HTH domain